MKQILLFMCFLLSSLCSVSQNFNYQLVKDSGSYEAIVSPVIIAEGNSWAKSQFELKLPFLFMLCGKATDSIVIEKNGYIEFVGTGGLSIISFNNFGVHKDTSDNYNSLLSYEIMGSSGNRILKMQFLNLSQSILSSEDNLSYQIWLFENGNKIEFHIGNSSYAGVENFSFAQVGILNRNMEYEGINALMLSGDCLNPLLQNFTLELGDLGVLNAIPYQGLIYRFIPMPN